jgi:ubiquitin C-terminal hydrolase
MFATQLYNFFTDEESYSAVGTNVYDAIWGVITWYPDMSEIESIERINMSSGEKEMLKPEIIKAINVDIVNNADSPVMLKGMKNVGGFSCFMDSILFPLLIIDGYFKDKLLKPQKDCPQITKALETIQKNIIESKEASCVPLISAMKNCDKIKNLVTGAQQDDSEFLIKLMDLYDLTPTLINTRRYLSNNKRKWTELTNTDIKQSVLEIMPDTEELLKTYQKISLEEFDENNLAKDDDGDLYKYTYSADRILSSEALVLHTQRKLFNRKNRTPVKISKVLKDELRDIYYGLTIVTIHHGGSSGGHYTSFFRWGDDWYHYDDLRSVIKIVDWETVEKKARTDSSLFIYYPN